MSIPGKSISIWSDILNKPLSIYSTQQKHPDPSSLVKDLEDLRQIQAFYMASRSIGTFYYLVFCVCHSASPKNTSWSWIKVLTGCKTCKRQKGLIRSQEMPNILLTKSIFLYFTVSFYAVRFPHLSRLKRTFSLHIWPCLVKEPQAQ